MKPAKTHIVDIRLYNNGRIRIPVCKATAPLLDMNSTAWEFAKAIKDATCKVCRQRYPRRYPWTKEKKHA